MKLPCIDRMMAAQKCGSETILCQFTKLPWISLMFDSSQSWGRS